MPEHLRDGVSLYYEIEGQGPPLMLIAGTASDSASWAPLVAALSSRFTLVRPDNRSTGRTRPTEAPLSVELWAEDALALLAELGLGPAAVVGHSLGGLIALQMAAKAPSQVSRLGLLASAPLRSARNAALFNLLVRLRALDLPQDLWLRSFLPWIFHPRFFDGEGRLESAIAQSLAYPHAQTPAAMAAQVAALTQFDPSGLVQQVRCPTLAVLAQNDLLIPPDVAQAALAPLADLRVETIAEAGHSLHWDAPEATLAALLPFLLETRR